MRKLTLPIEQRVRSTTGLTQEEFCEKYLIDIGTLRGWEQGRRKPDRATVVYLHLIEYKPKRIALWLEELRKPLLKAMPSNGERDKTP